MERLELEYYYGKEAEQFTFYRLPKALIITLDLRIFQITPSYYTDLCLTVCLYQREADGLMKIIVCLSSMLSKVLWKISTAVR